MHHACLTSKVLAVEVGDGAGGTGQYLEHLHVPACGGQVERSVTLPIGEIDGGSCLNQHLDNVGLSRDDGEMERCL